MRINFYLLLITVLILPAWNATASLENPDLIVVGSVSDSPKEETAKFEPLPKYLASKLAPYGITEGTVAVAPTMKKMADLMKSGKVDLFIDSSFPAVYVSTLSSSVPFLRRWKKGVAEYHSVIFVREDSGIEKAEDLSGKIVAFEKPGSTTAYLMPKAMLMKEGLHLVEVESVDHPVGAGEVGYVFGGDEQTIMMWVRRKRVAAGAFDNEEYEETRQTPGSETKILLRSIDLPRHVVSHRSGIPADLLEGIRETLLAMDQTEDGRAALLAFEKTRKFDEFPEGAERSFEKIAELYAYVQKEVEHSENH